jgi:hypothetical protein
MWVAESVHLPVRMSLPFFPFLLLFFKKEFTCLAGKPAQENGARAYPYS